MSRTSPRGRPSGRARCLARRGVGIAVAAGLTLTGGLALTASASDTTLTADDDANVIVGLSAEHMWSNDGGATWRQAAPEDEFKGRQTVLVATLDADAVASTPWDERASYATPGTIVSHDGALWSNQWWANPGERPGEDGVWTLLKRLDTLIVGELQFTPWSGDRAQQFQDDQRQQEIDRTKVVGYLPEWGIYDGHDHYGVADVPFDKITHLNYAFALLVEESPDEWTIGVADEWAALEKDGGLYQQVREATAEHGVENMLSVGGWTNSENGEFEAATATPEKAEQLAQDMVDFMAEHGFTGLDIDWEYPSDAAGSDQFEDLITQVRGKLTALGMERDEYFPLSIAVTPKHTAMSYIKPEIITDYVDSVNVMTYDYHGAFDPVTGHNAPLQASSLSADPKFSLEATMREYHEVHGIPKNQLLVGVPYYGRAWGNVEPTELREGLPGLGAAGTATVHGKWDDEGQFTGTNPWNLLKSMEQDPAYAKYWDDESQVPYLYNSSTQEFFTYDDPTSIQAKVDFIKDNGFGGAIIWELSGDTADHELGSIVAQVLEPAAEPAPADQPRLQVTENLKAVDVEVLVPTVAYGDSPRYVVRHNGEYLYEFFEGRAYYSTVATVGDDTTIRKIDLRTVVAGDTIELVETPGRPGQSSAGGTEIARVVISDAVSPSPAQLEAIQEIGYDGRQVVVRMADESFESAARYVVYVNGSYAFETHDGRAYYSSRTAADGITTVTHKREGLVAGDTIEVRLVGGKPGWTTDIYQTVASSVVE